jgi:O-antigen ligase
MFQGSALAFNVRRADYVAYVYIRVDGQPANRLPRTSQGEAYILLKSPTLEPSTDLILAADGLDPGLHSVEARFYLGYERWLLAGIAIGEPPNTRDYDLPIAATGISLLLGVLGTVLLVRRLPRRAASSALSSILVYLRQMADILAAILISILTSLGLILSVGDVLPNVFRRDVPTFLLTALTAGLVYFSPAFIVTAAGLVVLWLIIYNRPVVGLALIIFWAPFFLLPVQLYLFALPMIEICLVLAVSAAAARAGIGWAGRRKLAPPPANGVERRNQSAFRLTLADWAILAFVVVGTLSLAWSEQINPALREWRLMVIEPALFYLLLRTARLSGSDAARLVDAFLLAGTAIAVIGLIEYFDVTGAGIVVAEQGARRLNSVYWSPNNAALLLGRCIPYGFAMLLLAPGGLRRALAGLMTLIMLIAVLLTQSAGAALLGVPASLIVVLLLWDRRRGALATLLIVLGLLSVIPLSRFIPRLQGVLDLTRSSSFVRTQLWTSSFYLLRERPLTGAGLDQFLYLYRSRYILPEAWAEPDLSHPHNLILDYWISLGLTGLPILAALQLSFWRSGLAAWRRWGGLGAEGALTAALVAGALGSMANFLVHGLVDNSYFVVDLAFVFCFTLALSQSAASRQDQV